jgi:hypothetical protein
MRWEMSQSLCLSLNFPKSLSLILLPRPRTRIMVPLPQLMKSVTTMGIRMVPPCLPLVVGAYSPQHRPPVVGAALRAVVAVARLSGALSAQWVSGGTQAASGVVTVMICWSMLVRMSGMANLTAISIIMRCVDPLFPSEKANFWVLTLNRWILAFRTTVLSLQDAHCGRALYNSG